MKRWKIGAIIGFVIGICLPWLAIMLEIDLSHGLLVFPVPLAIPSLIFHTLPFYFYFIAFAINWSINGAIIGYLLTKIKRKWKKGVILGGICGVASWSICFDILFRIFVIPMPHSTIRFMILTIIIVVPILFGIIIGAGIGYLTDKYKG